MRNDNNDAENVKTWHDKKGKFAKNNPGKQPGTSKNKLRDKIKEFINSNFDRLPEYFSELKPKEKCEIIIALLPYAVSRLQSIQMNESDAEGNPVESKPLAIDYSKLSQNAIDEILNSLHVE
jgi:hypothetical protein